MKHAISILILICFPLFIFSQEQVTYHDYFDVLSPTYLQNRLGFANIDSDQYMIQESDSLRVSKLIDGEFRTLYTKVNEFTLSNINRENLFQNRSLLNIDGSKYYRIFYSDIEVIDIPTGEVLHRVHFDDPNKRVFTASNFSNNRLFFSEYFYDFENSKLDSLPLEYSYFSRFIKEDNVLLFHSDSLNISKYNISTQTTEVLYTTQEKIIRYSNESSDNAIYFIVDGGDVFKIDGNYEVSSTGLKIEEFDKLKDLRAIEDYLIYVYETDQSYIDVLGVKLLDFKRKINLDISNIYNDQFQGSSTFEIIQNAKNDESFTIMGFRAGYSSSPKYYVIDSDTWTLNTIADGTNIFSFTPVKYNNSIYASHAWAGDLSYGTGGILEYDLAEKTSNYLLPNENWDYTYSGVLGFPNDDGLVMAINNIQEEMYAWHYSDDKDFTNFGNFNFDTNLGLSGVRDITIKDDLMFFKAYGGTYILNTQLSKLAEFKEPFSIGGIEVFGGFAVLDDEVAFIINDNNTAELYVVNTKTLDLEVISDNIPIDIYRDITQMGPLLFFSSDSQTKYFDLKDRQIKNFEASIFRLQESDILVEDTRFIYENYSDGIYSLSSFDFESNENTEIDLEFSSAPTLKEGLNSFYIIENFNTDKSCKIWKVKNINDIELIYEGRGRIRNENNIRPPSHQYSNKTIKLYTDDENVILVSNDGDNTSVIEIQDLDNGRNTNLLNVYEDHHILKTVSPSSTIIWYYKTGENPINILEYEESSNFFFTDIRNNEFLLLSYDRNSIKEIITYDFLNDEKSVIPVLENDFYLRPSSSYALTDSKYLLSIRNDEFGYEPWIFDKNNSSFEILKDINPGSNSSQILNVTEFKDHIYFTAQIKNGSRQWFRLKMDGTSSLEPVGVSNENELKVFPSPTNGFVQLAEDVIDLDIISSIGEIVIKQKSLSKGVFLDVSSLDSGMYFLRSFDRNGILKLGQFIKL